MLASTYSVDGFCARMRDRRFFALPPLSRPKSPACRWRHSSLDSRPLAAGDAVTASNIRIQRSATAKGHSWRAERLQFPPPSPVQVHAGESAHVEGRALPVELPMIVRQKSKSAKPTLGQQPDNGTVPDADAPPLRLREKQLRRPMANMLKMICTLGHSGSPSL
jgi:hypothetical protein